MLTLRLKAGSVVHIGNITLLIAVIRDGWVDMLLIREGWDVEPLVPMHAGCETHIENGAKIIVGRVRGSDVKMVFDAPKSVQIQRSEAKKKESAQTR